MLRILSLTALLLIPALSFAQPMGPAAPDSGMMVADAGVTTTVVTTTVVTTPLDMDAPIVNMKGIYTAIKSGQGWLAAMLILLTVVGLLRVYGKKAHEWLMQFGSGFLFYVNKPFWFFFETKVGGWVLNWMTAIAGALGTAYAAGVPVDAKSWQVAVMSSTGATVIIELYKDITEWWASYKAKKAGEAAAAAVAAPALPKPPAPPVPPPAPTAPGA